MSDNVSARVPKLKGRSGSGFFPLIADVWVESRGLRVCSFPEDFISEVSFQRDYGGGQSRGICVAFPVDMAQLGVAVEIRYRLMALYPLWTGFLYKSELIHSD